MTQSNHLHKRKSASGLWNGIALIQFAGIAAAAGWIAYSRKVIDHCLPLPNAVNAPRQLLSSATCGMLNFYADRSGAGRPLVLLHAINAAASAYEVRPLFHHYQGQRPVFALELPGFGFSERSNRVYSAQLYQDAITEFLQREVKAPADVVALSLSSEFAASAALARPELFASLTLISPSGLRARNTGRATQRANDSGVSDIVYRAFSYPLWGQAFFDLLVTRKSIRWFLQQSFAGPVDEGLAEYDYLTAHQIGAHHAPLYFVSGKLFTRDAASRLYERLRTPTLALYDEDAFTSFELLPRALERNAQWRAVRIWPTRGLPHFERLSETTQALNAFWAGH